MKKHLFHIAACIALLSAATLHAQNAPAAPMPTQLSTAKTFFLTNTGANSASIDNAFLINAYNNLYRELATTNHYQMVAAPAAADLSLEFSVIISPLNALSTSTAEVAIQLVIRDAKTQALLWTICEPVKVGALARGNTAFKNTAESTSKLAADLKALTTAGSTPADASTKQP